MLRCQCDDPNPQKPKLGVLRVISPSTRINRRASGVSPPIVPSSATRTSSRRSTSAGLGSSSSAFAVLQLCRVHKIVVFSRQVGTDSCGREVIDSECAFDKPPTVRAKQYTHRNANSSRSHGRKLGQSAYPRPVAPDVRQGRVGKRRRHVAGLLAAFDKKLLMELPCFLERKRSDSPTMAKHRS